MNLFFAISVTSILSFVLTYIVKYLAVRNKIIDNPNERSLHTMPTPRLGGIAISVCWYIGLAYFYITGLIEENLFYALLTGFLITIVSIVDDFINLKAVHRLLIHFITCIIAFYFLNGLRPFTNLWIEINFPFLIYPVAIFGMVWFINLFNFMDGADGFAGNEAISIALVLFIFSENYIVLLFISSIMGFLVWNWPKAKIFMGDTGSTLLGFVLIVFGIYFHNNYQLSILNWILLAGPFWFDATFTLFRRLRNKEKLSQAHKKHAYQRFIQAGNSHLKLNIYLIVINISIVAIISFYRMYEIVKIPLIIITLFVFYYITKKIDKKIPFNK